ncbi:MAG: polysaccharide biosynthesis tyrosine autokinase [Candidatus Promineifilaceae bacterium]
MEIRAYLDIIWQQRVLVLATFLSMLVVATFGTLLMTPSYTATAQLRLATAHGGGGSVADAEYANRLMRTLVSLGSSETLHNQIRHEFALTDAPQLKVEAISFTELLLIEARHHNANAASNMANRAAELLIEANDASSVDNPSQTDLLGNRLRELAAQLDALDEAYAALRLTRSDTDSEVLAIQQVLQMAQAIYDGLLRAYEIGRNHNTPQTSRLSVVDVATPPVEASSPRLGTNITVGGVVGLLGGLGLALAADAFHKQTHETAQTNGLADLHTLATVPNVTEAFDVTDEHAPSVEAFRQIMMALFVNAGKAPTTILVTSAEAQEGKTTVVSNLAIMLSAAGQKVLAIDGNLRAPTLHQMLNTPNHIGLSDVLLRDVPVEEAICDTAFPRLFILPAGTRKTARGFYTARMPTLLTKLASTYDVLLIDTPAMLQYPDFMALSRYVDSVLWVVDGRRLERETLADARAQLKTAEIEPTGLILNHTSS